MTCTQSSQANFLLPHIAAQRIHIATPPHSFRLLPWPLSPSLSHYFNFLLYRSPPAPYPSSSSTSCTTVSVPSSFLYDKGSLRHCTSDPLLFPRSNLHSHWFVLPTPPHFLIWDNTRPKDLKILPKALVYMCLRIWCVSLCNIYVWQPYKRSSLILLRTILSWYLPNLSLLINLLHSSPNVTHEISWRKIKQTRHVKSKGQKKCIQGFGGEKRRKEVWE
jgi:hypothetical protein